MRSTKIAPLFLSNSYFTGSPPIGTSISTLMLCGTSGPDGNQVDVHDGRASSARAPREGHPCGILPLAKPAALAADRCSPSNREGHHEQHDEKGGGGISRHLLAGAWRLRQRGAGGGIPGRRHRPARRVAGVRPDGRHHGLFDRPYLGLSSKPGGNRRPVGRRALRGQGNPALHRRPGAGRDRRGLHALHHRQRPARLRAGAERPGGERRREPVARRLFDDGRRASPKSS